MQGIDGSAEYPELSTESLLNAKALNPRIPKRVVQSDTCEQNLQ